MLERLTTPFGIQTLRGTFRRFETGVTLVSERTSTGVYTSKENYGHTSGPYVSSFSVWRLTILKVEYLFSNKVCWETTLLCPSSLTEPLPVNDKGYSCRTWRSTEILYVRDTYITQGFFRWRTLGSTFPSFVHTQLKCLYCTNIFFH